LNSSVVRKKENGNLDFSSFIQERYGFDLAKSFAGRMCEYLVVIDEAERLLYVSEPVLEYAGIRLQDIKGGNFRQLNTKYLQGRHAMLLETLETGINYEGVLEAYDLGNQMVFFESSTMLLVDESGLKAGAMLFARDVTARVNGNKQMQQYETMKTINSFASSMSHHLKNPLTAVRGFVQLIKSGVVPENTEQYSAWALEELVRIEEILERISHLAMPSEGQQLIPLPNLLQAIKRSLQTTATTMQIKVQMDDDPPTVIVKGHYEQLREAVMCLVHNGMEAMPAGGHMAVTAHYHTPQAMVEIRVVDQGSGYYNPDNVFQPFFSTSVDRTGLGLNIAEHVAMAHRGYIKLRPNENGIGTTASLFLPAAVNISCDAAGISMN